MKKYLIAFSLFLVNCTNNKDTNEYNIGIAACKYGYVRAVYDFSKEGILLPDIALSAYANEDVAQKVCEEVANEIYRK